MTKKTDWIEVDRAEVPERTTGRISPASEALLDGKTIFVEGKGRAPRYAPMAKKRGFRVRSRTAERSGVVGTYVWLEPVDSKKG
jgi:hypothetical protein